MYEKEFDQSARYLAQGKQDIHRFLREAFPYRPHSFGPQDAGAANNACIMQALEIFMKAAESVSTTKDRYDRKAVAAGVVLENNAYFDVKLLTGSEKVFCQAIGRVMAIQDFDGAIDRVWEEPELALNPYKLDHMDELLEMAMVEGTTLLEPNNVNRRVHLHAPEELSRLCKTMVAQNREARVFCGERMHFSP